MKDELMNVKIKFTEQSARLAELKQEVSRLETKVMKLSLLTFNNVLINIPHYFVSFRIPKCKQKVNFDQI